MKLFKIIILALFLVILIFAPVIFAPRVISINEIECYSQYGPCNQIISEKIKSFEGKKLTDAKNEIRYFLSASSQAADFFVQFKLPDRLEVNIVEAKPLFAVRNLDSKSAILISKEGEVLNVSNDTNLPNVVTTTSLPEVGEKVDDETFFSLNIVYGLYSTYFVRSGKLENDGLVVEFPNDLTVIFPLKGDNEVLVGSLVAILSRLNEEEGEFRIDDRQIKEIDLRFKNPVLN